MVKSELSVDLWIYLLPNESFIYDLVQRTIGMKIYILL